MGVGMPEELPLYVGQGIDMMDCVLPTRNARNGYLFTSQGKVVIKQAQYLDDESPLDPACGCYTCRTFTRAYLRHLYQAGEILFSTLATLHNIRYYLDVMRRTRHAILTGKFPEFLKSCAAGSLSAETGNLPQSESARDRFGAHSEPGTEASGEPVSSQFLLAGGHTRPGQLPSK
jgi:queuine tRNA-ribosyltransferase